MRRIKGLLFIAVLISLISSCVSPEQKAEEYYEKGIKIFRTNDPKNALIEYEKGLEYLPTHARLLFESGNCYMNFRDYHTAIDFYTEAIKSDPIFADAYAQRAQSWFYLGDNDKSCADWLKAEELGKPNLSDKTKRCK